MRHSGSRTPRRFGPGPRRSTVDVWPTIDKKFIRNNYKEYIYRYKKLLDEYDIDVNKSIRLEEVITRNMAIEVNANFPHRPDIHADIYEKIREFPLQMGVSREGFMTHCLVRHHLSGVAIRGGSQPLNIYKKMLAYFAASDGIVNPIKAFAIHQKLTKNIEKQMPLTMNFADVTNYLLEEEIIKNPRASIRAFTRPRQRSRKFKRWRRWWL